MIIILSMGDLLVVRLWWAQVIDTPEDNKINVLRRGTLKGLIIVILTGGQIAPSSTLGDKA